MKVNLQNKDSLSRYLLEDMSDEERAVIEERFFEDDKYFDNLLVVEDDLVCAYLRGELGEQDLRAFEERFIKDPQLRQRVEFTGSLVRAVSEVRAAAAKGEQKPSWWTSARAFIKLRGPALGLASMAALLLVAAILVYRSVTESARLRSQIVEYQSRLKELEKGEEIGRERQLDLLMQNQEMFKQLADRQLEYEKLRRDLDRLQRYPMVSNPERSARLSFILLPGLRRNGGEPERLAIPKSARQIALQLDLNGDNSYKSFRAEIRTAGGVLVWSQDGLSSRNNDWGQSVDLKIPAGLLTNSEYELTLKGILGKGDIQDVHYYYMIIQKR